VSSALCFRNRTGQQGWSGPPWLNFLRDPAPQISNNHSLWLISDSVRFLLTYNCRGGLIRNGAKNEEDNKITLNWATNVARARDFALAHVNLTKNLWFLEAPRKSDET
jgi:hypothetical protein